MEIIAGIHRRRKLVVPKGDTVRPTASKLRGSLFNICQMYIEGTRFLDLFAGAGAMGLEALSRGSAHATFVDSSKHSVKAIRENIAALKEEGRTRVLTMDAFEAIGFFSKRGEKFDLIFADPPYGSQGASLSDRVLELIDGSGLLREGGELFLEDDEKASSEDIELDHLVLKSRRKVGRSVLRQFVLKPKLSTI